MTSMRATLARSGQDRTLSEHNLPIVSVLHKDQLYQSPKFVADFLIILEMKRTG